MAVAGGLAATASHAEAQADVASDESAQQLADRFAPVMMLKAQDHECDSDGEPFAPMAIDALLDNPQILLRTVGTANPVVTRGPDSADLFDLGEGFYLDFPGDALAPGCIYERDYQRYTRDQAAVVYAHVVADEAGGRLAVQYWFYWYYNDWNNKHESDWEGIHVLFDVGTVGEALNTDPVAVGYAQHEGGERAAWDSGRLERRGDHPVVYSSVGSHASYFGSALYLGRSGEEGFGCDSTDGPSTAVEPVVTLLPDAVDDPSHPQAWLAFEGRWGERQSGPFNGPTGPSQKERWEDPFSWHDDLRTGSVVVPSGDQGSAGLISAFCTVVEWGSAQMIALKQEPTRLLVTALGVFAVAAVALGRTDWSRVQPLPIEKRRRAGQMIKAGARLYRSRPRPFLTFGVVYFPVALAVGLVVAVIGAIPIIGALIDSDSGLGAVGVFTTLAIGGFGHAAGVLVVTAAAARYMQDPDSDDAGVGVKRTLREVATYSRDLWAGVARAALIVALLFVSVVGIPWGVRQLVRYQFVAQTTVLEGHRGGAALRRSSELIEGRWFHTAGVVGLVNGLVAVVGGAIGLLLLLLLSGMPLWLFSVIVSASSAIIVPYTAIVSVLLYGDAKAEAEGAEEADRLDLGVAPA